MNDGSDARGCLVDITALRTAARVLRIAVIAVLALAGLLAGAPASA
jgi:hypothetical protein